MCEASKNEKIVKVGDERRKAQCGTVAEHQNAALRLMSSKHLVAKMVLTGLAVLLKTTAYVLASFSCKLQVVHIKLCTSWLS